MLPYKCILKQETVSLCSTGTSNMVLIHLFSHVIQLRCWRIPVSCTCTSRTLPIFVTCRNSIIFILYKKKKKNEGEVDEPLVVLRCRLLNSDWITTWDQRIHSVQRRVSPASNSKNIRIGLYEQTNHDRRRWESMDSLTTTVKLKMEDRRGGARAKWNKKVHHSSEYCRPLHACLWQHRGDH